MSNVTYISDYLVRKIRKCDEHVNKTLRRASDLAEKGNFAFSKRVMAAAEKSFNEKKALKNRLLSQPPVVSYISDYNAKAYLAVEHSMNKASVTIKINKPET